MLALERLDPQPRSLATVSIEIFGEDATEVADFLEGAVRARLHPVRGGVGGPEASFPAGSRRTRTT